MNRKGRINYQYTELNGRSVVAMLAAAMAEAVAKAYDETRLAPLCSRRLANHYASQDKKWRLCGSGDRCGQSRGLLPPSAFRRLKNGRLTKTCDHCRTMRLRASMRAQGKRVKGVKRKCRYCGKQWTIKGKGQGMAKSCYTCRTPASDYYSGVGPGVVLGEIIAAERKHRLYPAG